jgi:hypothetical protein
MFGMYPLIKFFVSQHIAVVIVILMQLATAGGHLLFIAVILWSNSTSFIKLSLLCFFYRLVEHIHVRKYRWVLHFCLVFQITFTIAYILTLVFMCVPISAFWVYPPDLNAKCIRTADFLFTVSVINTILELVVWLLPLPLLFKLKLDPRQRVPVMIMLCLGLLVPVVGAVRCYYVYIDMVASWDVYWFAGPHWICSDFENNLSIICACLPALRPLIGRWFGFREAIEEERDELITPTSSNPAPDTPDSTYQMKYADRNNLVWFDLEGIADDGLGYSVSVTTGKPAKVNKERQTKKTGIALKGNPNGVHRLRTKKSRESTNSDSSRSDGEFFEKLRPFSRNRRDNRITEISSRPATGRETKDSNIVTRRTVEIRESFESGNQEGEEIRVWQSPSLNGDEHSMASSEEGMDERLDRLGVLPSTHASKQSANLPRPQTALAPVSINRTSAIPRFPEMAFRESQRPQWLSTPPLSLSKRHRRMISNPLSPRNSSQWWAASSAAPELDSPRNSIQLPPKPHTSAGPASRGLKSSQPQSTVQKQQEIAARESLRPLSSSLSTGDSFMNEIANLRDLIRVDNGGPEDDESVFVEDGSRTSGGAKIKNKNKSKQAPGSAGSGVRPHSPEEKRLSKLENQKTVKAWQEQAFSGHKDRKDGS